MLSRLPLLRGPLLAVWSLWPLWSRRLLLLHRYNELFELLSPELRQNVVQLMSQKTLETVWYFRVLKSMGEGMTDGNALKYKRQGTECLVELALAMKREAFAPR